MEEILVLKETRGLATTISSDGSTRATIQNDGNILITRNNSSTYDVEGSSTSSEVNLSGDGNPIEHKSTLLFKIT